MAKKTKLGCTILEGNDVADLPTVSENSEILEEEILKNSVGIGDLRKRFNKDRPIELGKDDDLNDIKEVGFYAGSKSKNAPCEHFYLQVIQYTNSSDALQIIYDWRNVSKIYVRNYKTVAGGDDYFTEWRRIDGIDKAEKSYVNDIDNKFKVHYDDDIKHINFGKATGTNTYRVSIDGITSLVDGMSIKVKFTNGNTGASTLNINGLGAKNIVKQNGKKLSSGNIKAGQIYHLVYNDSVFQLLGEGGEYGTATADDVLKGKTIGTEDGIVNGNIRNLYFSQQNQVLTTQGSSKKFLKGYYDRDYTVTAQFPNLIPENVKTGVNIGGVVGNLQGVDTDNFNVSNIKFDAGESKDMLYSQFGADGFIIIFASDPSSVCSSIIRIGNGDIVELRELKNDVYEYVKINNGVRIKKTKSSILDFIIVISFNLI